MGALLEVVLPVFLVIGFGVVAQRFLRMPDSTFEGLMGFAQGFAFPVLLFRGISRLDLAQTFNPPMLAAFYIGVTVGFFAGLLGARYLFRRDWQDCVAIAFGTAFSNGGLLGLPITERAYGTDALSYNFAIIAFHAPFVYLLGTTAMEIVRANGRGVGETVLSVAKGMAKNPMLIGIVLGAVVNFSGVRLPGSFASAVDLIAASAIPTALFALGGILARYKPQGDMRLVGWIVMVSLVVHPLTVFGLGTLFNIGEGPMRSAVLMAAMAPGVNTYVFANMYGVAKRVSATAVLVGTAASILTAWGWLTILG
ncbi:MAG: AEC family transporter [Maritimibacter sp.]